MVERLILAVSAALRERARALEAPGLRAIVLDVKLNVASGHVRVVVVRPEYEANG